MEVFKFLEFVSRLKHLPRKGWVLKGVESPETVAGHMYRMAMSTFLLPRDMNVQKIIKMALVHDLSESIVGDITPHDKVLPERKRKLEADAMIEILKHVPQWSEEEIFGLWEEYENLSSVEALFVKDLDKFDMILQGFEYEKSQQRDLSDFFEGLHIFHTDLIRSWASTVYTERAKYKSSLPPTS